MKTCTYTKWSKVRNPEKVAQGKKPLGSSLGLYRGAAAGGSHGVAGGRSARSYPGVVLGWHFPYPCFWTVPLVLFIFLPIKKLYWGVKKDFLICLMSSNHNIKSSFDFQIFLQIICDLFQETNRGKYFSFYTLNTVGTVFKNYDFREKFLFAFSKKLGSKEQQS